MAGERRTESAYSKLLRDPRWQKKRLEIMQKHGFACRECGCTDRELHVHHCYYTKGKKPWEYEDSCYVVLCNEHHTLRQQYEDQVREFCSRFRINTLGQIAAIMEAISPMMVGCVAKVVLEGDEWALLAAAKISQRIARKSVAAFVRGKDHGRRGV